jgi:hypothetical protein
MPQPPAASAAEMLAAKLTPTQNKAAKNVFMEISTRSTRSNGHDFAPAQVPPQSAAITGRLSQ